MWGINLLSDNPTRNAPIIASIPAASAKKAPRNTIANTKMYCEILSSKRLKNHRPIIGKRKTMISPKNNTDIESRIQNMLFTSPVVMPAIAAKTSNASVSVIIVPPIVMLTALFFATPSLLTIGYAISVCDANMLASKMDVNVLKLRIYSPATVPRIIGMIKVYNPNTRLLELFFLN